VSKLPLILSLLQELLQQGWKKEIAIYLSLMRVQSLVEEK